MADQEQSKAETNQSELTKPQNMSDLWKDFVENSTLHGLRHSVLRGSVCLRIVWSLLLLAALGYLIFSTFKSCERYFDYPTTFQISQKINNQILDFPEVTICSHNTADKDKIFALDNDTVFNSYDLNISACAATAEVRAGNPCGHALLCACLSLLITNGELIPDCDKSYQKKITDALNSSNVYFNFEEFYHTFSQSWSEVVKYCDFAEGKINCTPLEYVQPVIRMDGICYAFNSKRKTKDAWKSVYPGVGGGLRIMLESETDRYYLPKFSQGFSVFINKPGETLGSTGIYAGAGFLTSISLEVEKAIYLEDYGAKCAVKKLRGFQTYTSHGCLHECYSDQVNLICGCRPPGHGVYNDSITCYLNHKECQYTAVNFSYDQCDCPIACEIDTYNAEVSYGSLPQKSVDGVDYLFESPNYTKENYVIIEIGFKSLTYTLKEEKRAFVETSLLGEVGGNMGLLVGCSLITLVEFLDFFLSWFVLRFGRNNSVTP